MGSYSIKELEKLSGIKAHTLRIWEKRHNIINPKRTSTNIRFYDDDDLKKVLNISILNNKGYRISKICKLSSDEINQKVLDISEQGKDISVDIDRLVIAMIELDESYFEKILSNLTVRYGFEGMVLKVMYPFLEKIGVLWQTDHINPAHEHFISNIIRQKLMVAIDSLPITKNSNVNFMIFLPEGELHELGILFYNYLIRKSGFNTFYLGQSVPFEDLIKISETVEFHYLITAFVNSTESSEILSYLQKLSTQFPDVKIIATGNQVNKIENSGIKNIQLFDHVSDFKKALSVL